MSSKLILTVEIVDGPVVTVIGRDAWALSELINSGKGGCTPITHPGPRWSAYVFNLRRMGFLIETVHESYSGPFPGSHARYVLMSKVDVLEDSRSENGRSAA